MCGVKLMDRKNSSELMTKLGLTVLMEMVAKANAIERKEDERVPKEHMERKVKDSKQKVHFKEEITSNCTKCRKYAWTYKN